ncbi:MAG: type II toxin-antitoxin system prevent-host-death family antitoxin [Myxococcales bacterium]|jgi:prevent-host-death family protein|nr:type II toxin-antitoxin system prevent-host-death family antitoxin [Myxococcales bacterium]
MANVSVTELNQQTAKVLERVKSGESLEVREYGRPIARIVPVLSNASIVDRLVSEGRAVAATSTTEALLTPVPPIVGAGPSLSEVLDQARQAERS